MVRTLTGTLEEISDLGVKAWLVILVVNVELVMVLWVASGTTRAEGPLVHEWRQSGGQRMHSGCVWCSYNEQWW